MEQNMIRINPAKLAFGINLSQDLYSGQEVIEEMKRYTDINGVLYIPNIENCYSNDFAHLRLEMDYSKADEKEFALDADNLVKNIYGIFSFCKNWKNDSGIFLLQETDANNILPQDLFETWNTYIRDLKAEGFDDSLSKYTCGQEGYIPEKYLSEEQVATWRKFLAAKELEATKRIGDGVAAYTLIAKAQRLLRLLEMREPKKVLNEAKNILIISLAIHRFAKTKTVVKDVI